MSMLNLDSSKDVNTPALKPEEDAGMLDSQTSTQVPSAAVSNNSIGSLSLAGTPFAESLTSELETYKTNFYNDYMNETVDHEGNLRKDVMYGGGDGTGYTAPSDFSELVRQGGFTEGDDPDTVSLVNDKLQSIGLSYTYPADGGKYIFNPSTMTYDFSKQSDFGKFVSTVEPIVKTAAITMATAGIGSTLGASSMLSGLAPATQTAVGNAVAAGAVSAAQGGDFEDIVKNAALGGLNGYVKGAQAASEAANAAAGVVGATAEAAETARALQTSLDVATKVQGVVKIAEAVDDKNIMGVITNGLSIVGVDSLKDAATSKILSINPDNAYLVDNADELASAAIKVTDKLIKGESIDDAIKSGIAEYVKDGGSLSGLLPESGDFMDSEILKGIADTASEINSKYIKPVIEGINNVADETIRTLPTTKEDWQQAEQSIKTEVLDPTGEFAQEEIIDPIVETASEVNEEYVRPVLDEAGEVVDTVVDKVKDYGDEFGDLANNLIKGMLGGLSGGSQGGYTQTAKGSAPEGKFLKPELVQGFDLDQPFINPLLRG